jgi:hypothetical protein
MNRPFSCPLVQRSRADNILNNADYILYNGEAIRPAASFNVQSEPVFIAQKKASLLRDAFLIYSENIILICFYSLRLPFALSIEPARLNLLKLISQQNL